MTPGDFLSTLGTILDTPGAAVRTGLSGENPLEAIFDPRKRRSGRDMLEKWGVLEKNREGLDEGDVLGFLAENAVDPLNLVGGGLLTKAVKGISKARRLNKEAKAANEMIHEANLFRDLTRAKREELSRVAKAYTRDQQRMGENLIAKAEGKTIDVSKPAEWADKLPGLGHEAKMQISYGPAHRVAEHAEEIIPAAMPPEFAAIPAPHQEAINMVERAGGRVVPVHPDNMSMLSGAVFPGRPDLVFLARREHLPLELGTTAHELVHSAKRRFPDAYERLAEAVGPQNTKKGALKYYGGEAEVLAHKRNRAARGLEDLSQEEGLATVVGDAVRSAAERGADNKWPPIADIMEGGPWRRSSLVPTGRPVEGFETVKSFVPPPGHRGAQRLTPHENYIGSSPYIPLEAMQREPRARAATILAALLAHNAAKNSREY